MQFPMRATLGKHQHKATGVDLINLFGPDILAEGFGYHIATYGDLPTLI
jgi:hypothetical protein